MQTANGDFKRTAQITQRREKALKRLEATISSGTKKSKDGVIVPLSASDISRINKEIQTLKSRV